jgi:hypothetical protein
MLASADRQASLAITTTTRTLSHFASLVYPNDFTRPNRSKAPCCLVSPEQHMSGQATTRPSARNPLNPPDLTAGKFVASRTGEAYDARGSGPIGNLGLLARRTGPAWLAASLGRELDEFTIGN